MFIRSEGLIGIITVFQRQLQEVRGQMETEMRNHQRTRDQMQTNHKQMMELKQQVLHLP